MTTGHISFWLYSEELDLFEDKELHPGFDLNEELFKRYKNNEWHNALGEGKSIYDLYYWLRSNVPDENQYEEYPAELLENDLRFPYDISLDSAFDYDDQKDIVFG